MPYIYTPLNKSSSHDLGKRETLLKKGEKDREAVEIDDETQDYLSYEKALYEAKRQIAIQEYLAEKKKKEQ